MSGGYDALLHHLMYRTREDLPFEDAHAMAKTVVLVPYRCMARLVVRQYCNKIVILLLRRSLLEPRSVRQTSKFIQATNAIVCEHNNAIGFDGNSVWADAWTNEMGGIRDRISHQIKESAEPDAHILLRFRRAHEAHRDARLVFRAAADGRPLELQKRLFLGKLAGGMTAQSHAKLECDASSAISQWFGQQIPTKAATLCLHIHATPLCIALLRGHDACVDQICLAYGLF